MSRWESLCATIEGLRRQSRQPDEILLVADSNPELFGALESLGVGRVLLHEGARGCAGARNLGLQAANGDLVAFLDDDAVPETDWLEQLVAPLETRPTVVATGGWVLPGGGNVAPWYPKELYWVFGCSWAGLEDRQTLRNPIGASMAWRRGVLSDVGGFNVAIGHVGNRSGAIGGCEETLAGIQATALTRGTIVHARDAVVHHYVGPERVTFSYLLRRGFGEGTSKWVVRSVSGAPLRDEKAHSRRIAAALATSLAFPRRWRTALYLIGGLGATASGYLYGRFGLGAVGLEQLGSSARAWKVST
jgi:glycosyltransferase involved in cell wall biosynthesis